MKYIKQKQITELNIITILETAMRINPEDTGKL